MLSSKRLRACGVLGPIARTLVIAFTLSAAGCSADVTRFDFGSGGRNSTTSSIPMPPEPIGNGYGPNTNPRGLGLTEAPLPPTSGPPANYRTASYDQSPPPFAEPPPSAAPLGNSRSAGRQYDAPPFADPPPSSEPPGNYRVIGRQYKTAPPQQPPAEAPPFSAGSRPSLQPLPPATGETVEVQQGETLYSIGRRHGVPPAAIKDANGLTSDSVRPGQRLMIPGSREQAPPGRHASAAPHAVPPPESPAMQPGPAAQTAAPAVAPPPGWEGRYTMKNGDSLYGIAQRHRVSLDELKRANGITDPTRVWAGTVLNVPGQPDASAPAAAPPSAPPPGPPRIINLRPETIPAPEVKSVRRTDTANDAEPPAGQMSAGKFRWPVRGRVLAGFGRRPDGTQNDGLNIAVPHGTEIRAADDGKVAYAGNELKSFGNLVLIRHANGWVTAYAHADRLLVNKDDEVRRGQVIAKAGRTGSVDQPQVHFELRQGSRPIDPTPHLTE
jgi:murein DD-endopeptidase MepM/ murein hydrolase activator NlpD